MLDVFLECLRALVTGVIVTYVGWIGIQGKLRHHEGWWFIFAGFVCLFFGSVIDITDNFDRLNRYVIVGDTLG